MRYFIIALSALFLQACQPSNPIQPLSSEGCVELFKRYDFEISRAFLPPFRSYAKPNNYVQIERLERLLFNGQCMTRSNDVKKILRSGKDRSQFRAANGGATVPAQTMHFTVVTDHAALNEFTAYLRELGYTVDSVGSTRIGQRVYLRNLTSQGAIRTAFELAKDMEIKGTYLGRMRSLFY